MRDRFGVSLETLNILALLVRPREGMQIFAFGARRLLLALSKTGTGRDRRHHGKETAVVDMKFPSIHPRPGFA